VIPAYSQEVPILPGEYILNVLARGSGDELQAAVNFLGKGELELLNTILEKWLIKQGHSITELPEILETRREQIYKTYKGKATHRPHWTEENE